MCETSRVFSQAEQFTETYTIRPCTARDLRALQGISRLTFSDTFAPFTPPQDLETHLATAYASEKLRRELSNPNSAFFFLEFHDDENTLPAAYLKINIGEAQTEPVDPDALEIERIYVRPDAKHMGLGTALIEFSMGIARQMGITRAWLGVWEHNEPAKAFYRSMGFVYHSEHPYPVGNDPQTDWILVRDIEA